MPFSRYKFLKSLLLLIIVTTSITKSFGQSNVEVSKSRKGSVITVSNFPKNSTVLIVDEDFNLLSVVATNNNGSAVVQLNKAVETEITARTIHADIEASYKPTAAIQERQVAANKNIKGIRA